MGFFSAAGTIMTVGANVVRTVTSLGVNALKAVGSVGKFFGKTAIGKALMFTGIGVGAAKVLSAPSNGSSGRSGNFFTSIRDTIQNATGGVASVAKNIVNGINKSTDGIVQTTGLENAASGSTYTAFDNMFGDPNNDGAKTGTENKTAEKEAATKTDKSDADYSPAVSV